MRPLIAALRGVGMPIALLGLAAALLLTTRWTGPINAGAPEALFSAGPFRAGEAFEQEFVAPAAYLSGLRVTLHAPGTAPRPITLIFRLADSAGLVREGLVQATLAPDDTLTQVAWAFPAMAGSRQRPYRLQVAMGPDTQGPVFAMTHARDYLPGAFYSNGIVAPANLDLTLDLQRNVGWTSVLMIVGGGAAGVVGLGALGLVAGGVTGLGSAVVRRAWIGDGRLRGAWLATGVGVAAVASAVVLRIEAGNPAPENGPDLWRHLAAALAVPTLAPWATALAIHCGRYEAWLWRGGLVALGVAVALVFVTDPGPWPGVPVPFAAERPLALRGAWLGQAPGLLVAQVAAVILTAAGFMHALRRARRRERA